MPHPQYQVATPDKPATPQLPQRTLAAAVLFQAIDDIASVTPEQIAASDAPRMRRWRIVRWLATATTWTTVHVFMPRPYRYRDKLSVAEQALGWLMADQPSRTVPHGMTAAECCDGLGVDLERVRDRARRIVEAKGLEVVG